MQVLVGSENPAKVEAVREAFGWGITPMWELPGQITPELLGGVELGDVMDRVFGD